MQGQRWVSSARLRCRELLHPLCALENVPIRSLLPWPSWVSSSIPSGSRAGPSKGRLWEQVLLGAAVALGISESAQLPAPAACEQCGHPEFCFRSTCSGRAWATVCSQALSRLARFLFARRSDPLVPFEGRLTSTCFHSVNVQA